MFVLEGNIACVRILSNLNVLVFVLEENLTQARFLILYNVVVGNVFVFVVDINLALVRFLTLKMFLCARVCAKRKSNTC